MSKRILAMIMASLLALTVLSGCSGGTPEASVTAFTEVTATTAATATTATTSTAATAAATAAVTTATTTAATATESAKHGLAEWSVFMYLCGTDLETNYGAATSNLVELAGAGVDPETVNYIIQTGGTSEWQCGFASDKLQRYELANDDYALVDERELASMGDGQTLADFLSWGVENYPAEHYMVVFWNHGGGSVAGVEFDELFENDSLDLNELSYGLKAAGVTFDVIGFDTCLMASLENAAAVAPYGNYMVASEETEPGGGWDYAVWPAYLSEIPDCTDYELGTVICDSYMAKCEIQETAAMATLSVIDLTAVGALTESFDAMAYEMETLTTDIDSLVAFVQSSTRAENYGGNTETDGYTNMIDLGDLILETQDVLPETADATIDALFNTVVYQVKGENRAYANGLSVFYPLGVSSDICDTYAEIATSENYLRFIEAVIPDWTAPDWVAPSDLESANADDYNVVLETTLDEEAYFTVEVTESWECVESVLFSLYYMDYDSDMYIHLGTDDDMYADWDNYIFKDNFRGVWITLDGCYCAPKLIAQEDAYNLYSIPVMLNGSRTNLRAVYVWEDECYYLLGAYDGLDTDTGMAAREVRQIADGDVVEPIFSFIDSETGETSEATLNAITVSGALAIEESPLVDGDYLYQYEVSDAFGRTTYSDTAIMECAGGEITVYIGE
ncbi:MAG: clostripain-related cysteine peptidase [Clostridiaceae bacterium]|nr:clostripain-related cysteine peptidase [Clostridiaceae bacterium]